MHWNYGIRYGFFNNLMGGQIFMWILVLVIVFFSTIFLYRFIQEKYRDQLESGKGKHCRRYSKGTFCQG